MMIRRGLLIVGCGCLLAGLIAAEPAASAVAEPVTFGAGMELHTHSVHKIGLSGDGSAWAVRSQNNEVVLARWTGAEWETVASTATWPARVRVVELAADPANPAAILSIWETIADGSRILQAWRHAAGDAAGKKLGEVENPTVSFSHPRSFVPPRATVDAEGGVWATFKAPYLLHIPADSGETRRWDLPVSDLSEPQRRHYSPLVYTPASAGSGWLWAWLSTGPAKHADKLTRPLRVVGGRLDQDYEITGLPADAQVTLVARTADQRTLWAVENEGLWDIDEDGGRAARRSSPPGARILDWCDPVDGLEVAIVVPHERRTDGSVTELWIRKDGAWRLLGPTGSGSASLPESTLARGGLHGITWMDGLLLSVQSGQGLIVADLEGADNGRINLARPDWRHGFNLDRLARVLPLKNSAAMIVGGGGAVVATTDALRRVANGAESPEPPGVFSFTPYTLRAKDGRLWYAHTIGEKAPLVRHWDGERWHDWPLPADYRTEFAYGGLWVNENGRVAVFPRSNLDDVAWERDVEADGGWRRWKDGWALIEQRARLKQESANAVPIRIESRDHPAISADGRALVDHRGDLRLWTGEEWRTLATYSRYSRLRRTGFAEDGRPWTVFNDKHHVFDADGTRHETAAAPVKFRHAVKVGAWPEWLSRNFEYERVLSTHQDSEGVWWVLHNREIWKGWRGHVVRVFQPEEPSPFRRANETVFTAVYVGARGERLFECNSPVLLPRMATGTPRITWMEDVAEPDRLVRVSGDGLAHMEWRLEDGPWRLESIGDIELRELGSGTHVLTVRGFNRRLEAGVAVTEEFVVDYDEGARISDLLRQLKAITYAERRDAVSRFAAMGRRAVPRLETALAAESEPTSRWWLRAALQAIADGDSRAKTPDNLLTTP